MTLSSICLRALGTYVWTAAMDAPATAVLVLSVVSAYAFSRLRFKGREPLLQGMLLLQMFQPVLALVAIYAIFDRVGDMVPRWGSTATGAAKRRDVVQCLAGSRMTADELETTSRSTSSNTLTVSRRIQAFQGATEK